jgi:hypothetical protein
MRTLCAVTLAFSLLLVGGCEAFARKFTRKPKKGISAVEMVFSPEQYENDRPSSLAAAQQAYVFWKSWHAEMILALENGAGYKRRLHCAREALLSLRQFAAQCRSDFEDALQQAVHDLDALMTLVEKDRSGLKNDVYAARALRLKDRIEQQFRYSRIEEYIW